MLRWGPASLAAAAPASLAALLIAAALRAACAAEPSTSGPEVVQIPLNPLPFDLKGYLRRPNGTGPFPAVVLIPACGRFGSSVDRDWGEALSAWGYVALTLDIFTAHGIPGRITCLYATGPELAEDAYRGLNLLIERKLGDPGRVFIAGFGRGGSLAFAAVSRDGVMQNAKHRFRGAVAFYPPCGDVKGVMAVPTLVLVGARDERTLDGCRRMAAGEDDMGISRRPDAGAPIQLIVLPDAYGGFDAPAFQKPVDISGLHFEYSKPATDEAKEVLQQFLQTIAGQVQ
jgi:dienelactone hydrolase